MEFNGKPNTLYLAFGQRATADVNIGVVGIIVGWFCSNTEMWGCVLDLWCEFRKDKCYIYLIWTS